MRRTESGRRGGLGQARNVIASIAISGFGTWSYNVGIAVYTYDRTHSAAWVAAVTVGRYVPALLLNWWAAALVDRLPRRGLVVTADLFCGAIMLALGALAAADAPLWLLTVVAALSSTAARVQASAVLSLAADVVVESQLARASALAAASEAVATAAGSAAASLILIHFTAPSLFVLNAVTFVASAVLIGKVPPVPVRRHRPAAAPDAATPAPVSRSALWPLQASRTLVAYVYGTDIVLLTVIAARQLHSGTSGYGWLLAAAGLGGLIAVLAGRRWTAGVQTARLATGGLLVYAAPLLIFALAPPVAGGIGTQILRGAGSVFVTSSVICALQRAVPSARAGRVFGTTQSLVLAGTCVGSLLTPALLGTIGFDATIVFAALAPCVIQLFLHPLLVRFDRQEASVLAALDPRLATLRRLDLLRDANRSTLYAVADGVVDLRVEAGAVVVREGDASEALFVLVSGRVEVTGGSAQGQAVLRQLSAPDYFGEIGLLHGVPRTATVTALEPCEFWQVPADLFLMAVSEAGVSGALMDTVRIRFDSRVRPAT